MEIREFFKAIKPLDIGLYTGVPDSILDGMIRYVEEELIQGISHVSAPSEGVALALAAGFHLGSARIPLVYLQNSGLGNLINPVTSLVSERVHGIPVLFVMGWRGEPGKEDEPQHQFQGETTQALLGILGLEFMVIHEQTTPKDLQEEVPKILAAFREGRSYVLLITRGALVDRKEEKIRPVPEFSREEVLARILKYSQKDPLVATTGKTSRELYEIRKRTQTEEVRDFLNIGAMGHSLGIALGLARGIKRGRVWCLDGDGAALMHLSTMALVGSEAPKNLIHVLINNGGHESVGGQALSVACMNFQSVARAFGYVSVFRVEDAAALERVLASLENGKGPFFIEVMVPMGSRSDLSRPGRNIRKRKEGLMAYLKDNNQ